MTVGSNLESGQPNAEVLNDDDIPSHKNKQTGLPKAFIPRDSFLTYVGSEYV